MMEILPTSFATFNQTKLFSFMHGVDVHCSSVVLWNGMLASIIVYAFHVRSQGEVNRLELRWCTLGEGGEGGGRWPRPAERGTEMAVAAATLRRRRWRAGGNKENKKKRLENVKMNINKGLENSNKKLVLDHHRKSQSHHGKSNETKSTFLEIYGITLKYLQIYYFPP